MAAIVFVDWFEEDLVAGDGFFDVLDDFGLGCGGGWLDFA